MSVQEHCRIVGRVAQELIKRLPAGVVRMLPQGSATIAALHDVGKVSPGFQKKIAPSHADQVAAGLDNHALAGLETSHAKISQAAVNRFLGARFEVTAPAAVVGAHHGFWQAEALFTDNVGTCGGDLWSAERRRLLDALIAEFGCVSNEKMTFPIQSALAGFITVADWIGSDEEFFPPSGLPSEIDLSGLVGRALSECGWRIPHLKPGLSFEDIFDGRRPYPIQKEFIDAVTGPGLYILEAPMGCGKTEAALYVAYRLMTEGHNMGIYFGLPTRLTSDKIHERISPFLEKICADKTHARLAHGLAWLKEFERGGKGFEPHGRYADDREDDEPRSSWFNPRKRALLWPFAVGTIDQALLCVVRAKHHFVRTFGLAGKIVVLDEVHSYDMYTGSLIENLVKQLLELDCTVIVLSATLTGERRGRLMEDNLTGAISIDYPLISRQTPSGIAFIPGTASENREYAARMVDLDSRSVAQQAVDLARQGCCVLCIANTIDRAQTWYDSVKGIMPEGTFDVGLLHSKFPAFRREQLESEWLAKLGNDSKTRPNGCVLVATQVVEQSVDIDADCLVSELAPTDMLLQRIGRVWRHPRTFRPCAKPDVRIVCGDVAAASNRETLLAALGDKSCFVYQPYVLWRTWQSWHTWLATNCSGIVLPRDIRELINLTYTDGSNEEPLLVHELKVRLELWRDKLQQYACASLADVRLPPQDDDEDVITRYSERPMQDVFLVRRVISDGQDAVLELLDGELPLRLYAYRKDFLATKRLHRQIVSVPKYIFKRLGVPPMPQWLRMHVHAATPIWVLSDDLAPLTMDDKETGYTYDKWRGLRRLPAANTGPQSLDEFEDYDSFEGEER